MKLPMREKYVDERVGVWIVFGWHFDGSVDVSSKGQDLFTQIPLDVADRLCELQEEFREKLYALLCR
jgi:hypothetical protein